MSGARMSEKEILEKVQQIIAKSLRIQASEVLPESYLDEDLGAQSIDLVEMEIEMEESFNIWLPEKNILQTAGEIFGPGILETEGVLTEAGKSLLLHRLPPSDAQMCQGEVRVSDLRRYFLKVRTWAHMIHGLLAYTPDACPACGGALAASPGFRMKCKACTQEITLRSGDELNREWVKNYYESEYLPSVKNSAQSVGAPV